jgi:hypothetical protein
MVSANTLVSVKVDVTPSLARDAMERLFRAPIVRNE